MFKSRRAGSLSKQYSITVEPRILFLLKHIARLLVFFSSRKKGRQCLCNYSFSKSRSVWVGCNVYAFSEFSLPRHFCVQIAKIWNSTNGFANFSYGKTKIFSKMCDHFSFKVLFYFFFLIRWWPFVLALFHIHVDSRYLNWPGYSIEVRVPVSRSHS